MWKNKVLCKHLPKVSGQWKILLEFFKIHLDKAMADLALCWSWPCCKKSDEALLVVPSSHTASVVQWNMPDHCKPLALSRKNKTRSGNDWKEPKGGNGLQNASNISVFSTVFLWLRLPVLLNQREKCLQLASALHSVVTKSNRNFTLMKLYLVYNPLSSCSCFG